MGYRSFKFWKGKVGLKRKNTSSSPKYNDSRANMSSKIGVSSVSQANNNSQGKKRDVIIIGAGLSGKYQVDSFSLVMSQV